MDAVNRIERYLSRDPGNSSARCLAELSVALERNETFPLEKLFGMDYEAFELALALMSEWRTDRFFAERIGLLDNVKAAMRSRSRVLEAA